MLRKLDKYFQLLRVLKLNLSQKKKKISPGGNNTQAVTKANAVRQFYCYIFFWPRAKSHEHLYCRMCTAE